jgi:alpha-ribazole phosphatase
MTRKTRLHLIRHGEVANAGVPRYNGHTDVGLSERGVAMYHDLKGRFSDRAISACYVSDLQRCVIGARILGEHLGLEPVIHRELREMCVGVWEGKSWAELMAEYPDEWQARLDDIVNYRIDGGGENLLDVHGRVMPVIHSLVERHRGEEILVVAHGGVNRIILLDAIGAPLSCLFSIEQNYCCRNIIDYYEDGRAVVKLVNENLNTE